MKSTATGEELSFFIAFGRTNSAETEVACQNNQKSTSMSAGGAFGGTRGARPVPPEKGIFPLDHMHECDLEKKDYISCLKSSAHNSEKCRHFSKKYLQCRMDKNLMAKQDLSELGFGKEADTVSSEGKNDLRIDS